MENEATISQKKTCVNIFAIVVWGRLSKLDSKGRNDKEIIATNI
jgi:hypothetical protein